MLTTKMANMSASAIVFTVWAVLFAAPASGQEVVGRFSFQNDSRDETEAQIVSFGHVFEAGLAMPDAQIGAVVDGRALPTQIDTKALHSDGSVRHAIVTVALPGLGARATANGELHLAGTGPVYPTINGLTDRPNLEVKLTLKEGPGAPRSFTLKLSNLMANTGTQIGKAWLDGALARETRHATSLTGNLEIEFDVWRAADGQARVDVIFHNDWTGTHDSDTLFYDVEIIGDGTALAAHSDIEHYPFSTWHEVIRLGASRAPRFVPDLDGLVGAGAIPRFERTFRPSAKFVEEMEYLMADAEKGPLGSATLERYMPTTGGRWDIGPLPGWAVAHVLGGSAFTENIVYFNADASGSIPWHLRDKTSRMPLTLDDYPTLWFDERGETISGIIEEPFAAERYGWAIDVAHQPSLTYLPYLLTGSRYYADELRHQAAFNFLNSYPEHRGDGRGLFVGASSDTEAQVRDLAWGLRTLAQAAFILPDTDPLKEYFNRKLTDNLTHFKKRFIEDREMRAAGEVEGWIPSSYEGPGTGAAWQHGFLVIVFAWLTEMGYEEARPNLQWMGAFVSGLFANGDNGFDPERGVAYTLQLGDEDTGKPFGTWAKVYERSNLATVNAEEAEDDWLAYGPVLRGAVAALLTSAPSPNATKAFGFLAWRTWDRRWIGGDDATFALVPQMPDGSVLDLDGIKGGTYRPNTYAGTDRGELYFGLGGDDNIDMKGGDDLAFGGEGNDVLIGGEGLNYLFGDAGDDVLVCDGAQTYCQGGAGADEFRFQSTEPFDTRILDFDPSTDRLALAPGLTATKEDLLLQKTGLRVTLSNKSTIFLVGTSDTDAAFSRIGPIRQGTGPK